MYLIVEGKPLTHVNTALVEGHHPHAVTRKHHLPIRLIKEDYTFYLGKSVREQVVCDLEVAHACDERTAVDEGVVGWDSRGNCIEYLLGIKASYQLNVSSLADLEGKRRKEEGRERGY